MDKLSILKVGTSEFEIADAEARETLLTKADTSGVYPKLVAGDLVESETKDDVFTYQVTDHTGKANINSIKGNTIVWNQLIQNGNFADTTNWRGYEGSTIVVSNNEMTAQKTGETQWTGITNQATHSWKAGHKYLWLWDAKSDASNQVQVRLYESSTVSITGGTLTTNYQRFGGLATYSADSTGLFDVRMNGAGTLYLKNVQCFDLTQMFGVGNEPTSVDEFTKLYPLPYYQYEQHRLLSFNGTGIKVTGKNLFQNNAVNTTLNGITFTINDDKSVTVNGTATGNAGLTHSSGLVVPNIKKGESLILSGGLNRPSSQAYLQLVYKGDETGQTYSYVSANSASISINATENMTINGIYMSCRDGSTFNNETFYPMLRYAGTDSTYEPYTESTLSLPIAQHFPNGMDGVGSDYDELTETKAYHRMARVDLGTLTWSKTAGTTSEYDFFNSEELLPTIGGTINALCAKYTTTNAMSTSQGGDKEVRVTLQGGLRIRDLSYSTASDFKTAMSGVYLVYPLANPTEEDVDLDLSYSTYEGGTEQLQPVNTDVPVTSPISMNVEFDFGENLNARLNKMLNCLAQVETSPSTHNYSVGQYLMYEYQLYKVTSAITTGQSLTVGTNITATTVMSELLSLTA